MRLVSYDRKTKWTLALLGRGQMIIQCKGGYSHGHQNAITSRYWKFMPDQVRTTICSRTWSVEETGRGTDFYQNEHQGNLRPGPGLWDRW